jgi:hypothetical protein
MCLVYARLSDATAQIHRNMARTTNLQKNKKFPKKKFMFSILKLKRAKNSDFFSRDRPKFQVAPQLLENTTEYTRIYKKKQN